MKRLLFILLLSSISFVFGTLVSPSDGDELNYIHILFEWEQQPDAVGYNLQVSTNELFNNLILDVDEAHTVYIDSDNFSWNETYYWRVRSIMDCDGCEYGDWIGTSMFNIGQSTPPYIDEGVEIESSTDIYQDDLLEDGYVAIGSFNPAPTSFIIDKYGNEIWNDGFWENEGWTSGGFMLNHINEYGNISGYSGLNYPYNTGMKANTDMDVVWSTMNPEPVDMHEFKQISNGNYMGFIHDNIELGPIPIGDWTSLFQAIGYQADGITNEFPYGARKIVEFDAQTKEEIWSWNPHDHYTKQDTDLYGGTWWTCLGEGSHDWLHSNAFHFDEEESVIYVSHRHISRISKIAYPSGEVIWNMGMPDGYGTGSDNICTDLGFSYQHNIQLLDDGSLLFFDNGNLSQILLGDSNPTSRIRRIRVIDNSYCETIWEYELPPNLFGSATGSVQLLDNGNYSIYTIASASVIEVTPEQEIIWKHTGNINNNWGWYYRAYKIPSVHPDAFSVIADNYTADENNNNIIQISGNSLDFTVINKSGYTQPYQFSFGESTDGPPMFDYEEGDFTLGPNESIELSFEVLDENISSTNINFSIWPVHHDYSLKELSYNITTNDTLLGDLNGDGTINVVDIVMLVNIILNGEEYYPVADLNSDGTINVVDIVTLVNIILN